MRNYGFSFKAFKGFVSPVYQLLDFELKSPVETIKKGLVAERASRVSSTQSYCRSF